MTHKIVAVILAAGVALSTAGVAHAETRLILKGTAPSPPPFDVATVGMTTAEWHVFNTTIGSGWLPGTTPKVVDYPASAWPVTGLNTPTMGQSVRLGQTQLDKDIKAEQSPAVVAGFSQGGMVIVAEQLALQDDPEAPDKSQLSFYLFADERGGLFNLFPAGTYLPGFDYTLPAATNSQYDTTIVYVQYDGLSNFPDRPWNLLADINALMGQGDLHYPATAAVPAEAVQVSQTTSQRGGKTTTYMIPTKELPLTKPLRDLGLPSTVTDEVDKALRPIIDAGYSNLTPEKGPHISQGKLVRSSSTVTSAKAAAKALVQRRSTLSPKSDKPSTDLLKKVFKRSPSESKSARALGKEHS